MSDLQHRLGVVGVIVTALFLGLVGRLGYLQVHEHRRLATAAEKLRTREEIIPVTRGRILDRHGRVIVDNELVSVVSIDKRELKKADLVPTFSRLATLVSVPFATLEKRFRDPLASPVRPVEVARGVKESAVLYIGEHEDRFPGVHIDLASQRSYPYGRLASHVVGYVRASTGVTLDPPCDNANYTDRDRIGLAGVEKSYECELRGTPGKIQYRVDKRNNILSSKVTLRPVPGRDVRLTIDVDVQQSVEESLVQALKAARGEVFADVPSEFLRACCGSAVVYDPQDGSVLAMASYPNFDPADFIGAIPKAEYQEKYGDINAAVNHSPLVNRAISGRYAPGSTFKVVDSFAALRLGLITQNTTVDDQGTYRITPCPKDVRCLFQNAGKAVHGRVDLPAALTVSSDVYFYRLADKVFHNGGTARTRYAIQRTAEDLGLDQETEIRLPNEAAPFIPDNVTREERHRLNKKAFPDSGWRTGDTMNTALGQGELLLTPLELANTYATLSNGGRVLRPRIAFDVAAQPVSAPISTLGSSRPVDVATTQTTTTTTSIVPHPIGPSLTTVANGLEVVADTSTTLSGAAPATTLAPAPPSPPDVRKTLAVSAAELAPIIQGLSGVLSSEKGTAYDAFSGFPLDTFPLAGKTGTAQQCAKRTETCKRQDNAVFVAFGPLPAPRYVVTVVLEEAGFGGWTAAPAARRIFDGLAGFAQPAVQVARGKVDR